METAPLVIIGAGPTGLAAAAHAHQRGMEATVLESGARAGTAVRECGHGSGVFDAPIEATAGGCYTPGPELVQLGTRSTR